MASLADTDSACLLVLVEESEATGRPIRSRDVARKFQPPLTEARAKLSLDYLVKLGFASSSFDNPRASGYLITRTGLIAAERAFDKEVEGDNTKWTASCTELSDLVPSTSGSVKTSDTSIQTEPTVVVNVENRIANPESGRVAWAGWLGAVLTAIGIVVALWIGGKI